MNSKYIRSQRILAIALLISLAMLTLVPGNITDAKALTGFVKVSPANGATGVAINPTLDWDSAPSNPYDYDMYYKYCYYTSGGTCNYQGTIYATNVTLANLSYATTYYWQVQVIYCKNSSCSLKEKHEANNGTVWSFKTVSIEPPGTFAKTSPANDAANITNPLFSWGSSARASYYEFCFSSNYNDSTCAYLGGWRNVGTVTTYVIPAETDTKFIWGSRFYWQVRAVNAGGTKLANDGTWWVFTTADQVGTAVPELPTGLIDESTPLFVWNDVNTEIDWYYLKIDSSTGNVFKQWYPRVDIPGGASGICDGTDCSVRPNITLGPGNYAWSVQAWEDGVGFGPWSNIMAFNTPIPTKPEKAVLVSPSGDIGADYSPDFTWNRVLEITSGSEGLEESYSTRYYLWISSPSNNKLFAKWYDAPDICTEGAPGTCTVVDPITLNGGQYTWWVQTYNSTGYGEWSLPKTFTTTVIPAPTLVSPTGSIPDATPTYQWNEVSTATWYYLWVSGPSGNVIKQWVKGSDVCAGGSCSVTPSTKLAGGAHTWWVQTWNQVGGYGNWSTSMSFTTVTPGAATLVQPAGNTTDTTPTYQWNEVSGAIWYYLWISDASGNIFKQWYEASAVCAGGSCSVTPAGLTLGNGNYRWWIQTWNEVGYGPWSAEQSFAVVP